MEKLLCNGLDTIVSQALKEMEEESGQAISLDEVNLAELSRRTHISRSKLRTWKNKGGSFVKENKGYTSRNPALRGYTSILDNLLRNGVYNSAVCLKRLQAAGYTGGISTIKRYLNSHKDLIPAKRQTVDSQGNRGRRYQTGPGENFQMDWGFVYVDTNYGKKLKAACFAMICHHCGQRYVEFFPNAKQENLFIGMLHAFRYLGVPKYVLTDNMKSVVIKRDWSGEPIWQKDYESFMSAVGFQTKLCKPRHPFTKGKVERLIRFVKENFLAGRSFWTITDLNREAMNWCYEENERFHPALAKIPDQVHRTACLSALKPLPDDANLEKYLCPERRISFDGFISYENRRFGVPFSYTEKVARVKRVDDKLYIYSSDMSRLLTTHPITWDRHDSFCKDQYEKRQPEELPTAPIRTTIKQLAPAEASPSLSFEKFNFDKEGSENE